MLLSSATVEQGLTDERLMERFQNGNAAAFQALVDRHGGRIFNFVLRHVRDRAAAEDLTQEVFLRVVKNARSFRAQSKFTTWLYTIARNQCIDALRKAKHRRHAALDKPLGHEADGATLLDLIADDQPDQGAELRDRRFVGALESALAQLPEEQREVFLMREVEGLKFREIADVMGIPENTVKSRMRYALEALRGHLARFEDTF